MSSEDEWDDLPSVVGVPLPDEADEAESAHSAAPVPKPATPKLATPKLAIPKPATPKLAIPKPATPKLATPKVALPKPVPLKLATPKPASVASDEADAPAPTGVESARDERDADASVDARQGAPDSPRGSRWRSAPPPPALQRALDDEADENAPSVGVAVPEDDPASDRVSRGVAVIDPDEDLDQDLDKPAAEEIAPAEGLLLDEDPGEAGMDRLSLTDLEIVDAEPPPPPASAQEPAVERLSLSEMDELLDGVTPPPPPAGGSANRERIDLDGLLADSAHVESTRPVVLSTHPPEEEDKRGRWPLLLAGLAAAAVVAYALVPKNAPGEMRSATTHESAAQAPEPTASTEPSARAPMAEPAPTEPAPEPILDASPPDDLQEPVAPATATVTADVPSHEPAREGRTTSPPRPARRPHVAQTPRRAEQATTEESTAHESARQAPSEAPTSPPPATVASAPPPPAPPVVESREDLPDAPTREQVQAAFRAIMPNLRACTGLHGAVPVRVTISGSGRVTVAVVQGHLAGTPEGSCIARAVRTARLPPFRQRRLNVNYPFVL